MITNEPKPMVNVTSATARIATTRNATSPARARSTCLRWKPLHHEPRQRARDERSAKIASYEPGDDLGVGHHVFGALLAHVFITSARSSATTLTKAPLSVTSASAALLPLRAARVQPNELERPVAATAMPERSDQIS
jgi:hypothetical protein